MWSCVENAWDKLGLLYEFLPHSLPEYKTNMPFDPALASHLSGAFGPGFETVFQSLGNETGPSGGTIAEFKKRMRKGKRSKSRSRKGKLGGGRSRKSRSARRHAEFDYNPRTGKLHYTWRSRRSASRSRSPLRRRGLMGGEAGVAAALPADAVSSDMGPAGGAMEAGSSRWIEFVRAYAKQHGCSYKRALKMAAPKWRSLKRKVKGMSPH